MMRLHISLSVADLDASITFYSALFAAEPSVHESDYAKWMLDDPRVNFSITDRPAEKGLGHLGIQAENADELAEIGSRIAAMTAPTRAQGETTCCYARSEKTWIYDPEGIAWETFLTHGQHPRYGEDLAPRPSSKASAVSAASRCC